MEFPVLSLCNCILRSPRGSRRAVALAAGIALFGAAGCQSIPRLHSPAGVAWTVASAPELIDESEKPLFAAAPDFDLPAESSPAVATSTSAPTSALTPASAAPAAAAAAAASAEPEKLPAASAPAPTVAAAPAAVPVPSATPQQPAGRSVEDKAVAVATETLKQATGSNSSNGKVAGSTAASNSVETTVAKVAQQPPKVSETQSAVRKTEKAPEPRKLPAYSERRPEAFAWRRTGRSAGGRPFEISLTGENGFRTLFIGSAVGNDPVPVNLMERLAKHIHDNGLILGGFEAAVIRTLNPDGAVTGQQTNALGRYVNGRFPPKPDQKAEASTPEADFLLGCIRSFRPQRIVHVRTVDDPVGVIASNERCAEIAQTISNELKFSRLTFPGHSREGSLEFCLSGQADLDVITLALPRTAKGTGDPWALYGDTLLNLLQPRIAAPREANRPSGRADEKSP